MQNILLTQNSSFIIGPVSWLLGKIMNGIFHVVDAMGIPSIGLTIILFTIVVNLLLLPLTIKQQKFSKLSARISPETQAITAKYKGKTDQQSQLAMNSEIQAVYAKYGVSPTGSCLPLLVQVPIIWALYRVIYAVPAYVTKIGETFRVLADKIIDVDNGAFLLNSGSDTINNVIRMYGKSLTNGDLQNGIVDVLNKFSTADMELVSSHYGLQDLTYQGQLILSNDTTRGLLDYYNQFLGLNMANSPGYMVRQAWSAGSYLLILVAMIIPVLIAGTQWISFKLMPQQDTSGANEQAQAMASSMKTMNTISPIMMAFVSYSLPAGIGLYWIAGNVVRGIQQVVINKRIDQMDFDEIIKQNEKKSAEKLRKLQERQEKLSTYANVSTKNIQSKASMVNQYRQNGQENVNSPDTSYASSQFKPGSMMAKANMVREYNEKNNK